MVEHFRNFTAADPRGQSWRIEFRWLQTAVSIRHGDAVDVKFALASGDTRMEKAVALAAPDLLAVSEQAGRPISDAWCGRLAALHIRRMIETWTDMEKALVQPSRAELEGYAATLAEPAA